MSAKPKKIVGEAQPKWETAVQAVCFLVLVAWAVARSVAIRDHVDLAPGWNYALWVTVAALVGVFVRRIRRAVEGMKKTGLSLRKPQR